MSDFSAGSGASFAALPSTARMATLSSSDLVVIALGVVLASLYLFKDVLFAVKSKNAPNSAKFAGANGSATDDGADSRDFVAKLKATVSRVSCAHRVLSFVG